VTNTVSDQLLSRIRKILEKTERNGCTEEESASAFAAAGRLMAEHNLTMADIASSSDATSADQALVEEEADFTCSRWELEHNLAYAAVQEHFFVRGLMVGKFVDGKVRKSLLFFGTRANVEAARYVFGRLLQSFEMLWMRHKAIHRTPGSERRAYVVGVARGYRDKLASDRKVMEAERDLLKCQASGGTALALRNIASEVNKAFEAKHLPKKADGTPKKPQHSGFAAVKGSQDTYEAGYQAGKKLSLNKELGSGGSGSTSKKALDK
jgi:hypothetical protein